MSEFLNLLTAYYVYGLSAFAVALLATPVAMHAARRFDVMDHPDEFLKPHARPTPYLGGAAICVGWALALALGLALGAVEWRLLVPVLLGGLAISFMGLVDDIGGIRPKLRLLLLAAIVAAVLLATGAGERLVDSVLGPLGWPARGLAAAAVSLLISLFIVLGACNSTNLIDGMDGLCAGVTALISLGFFLLAAHLRVYEQTPQWDGLRLVLALGMCGAALGFLPWNFNPARVFMGDAGSLLLGYNCGIMIVLFAENGDFRWVLAALMIFALPVFDTVLAMFRRWRGGRSIFEGDRSHFYDQLEQRGWSVRRTVLVSYGLTAVYGVIGLLLTFGSGGQPMIPTLYAVPFCLLVCLATGLVAYLAGLTNPEEPAPAGRPPLSSQRGDSE